MEECVTALLAPARGSKAEVRQPRQGGEEGPGKDGKTPG